MDILDILEGVTQFKLNKIVDDDVLGYTQGIRKKFVEATLAKGFPEDSKDQKVLLTALKDMDSVAINNKRIGASEKQTASDLLVVTALAELSSRLGQTNPFEGTTEKALPVPDVSRLPVADTVPGETDIGLSTTNYDEFVAKYD